MSVAITKAGPYYASGSISFSSLRTNFKESGSGSISASELRRNTTTSDTNPIVPDATENSSVSTNSNLAISQFRNTIKYYYITQTAIDLNFNIGAQSWNSNLNKNIRKWAYINGTCGSNSSSSPASTFATTVHNLTIDVSGIIYGAGGPGGTLSTISGTTGGTALSITNSSGSNLAVNVQSTANIYGGGGGGEKGAKGADGLGGTCSESYTAEQCGSCPSCAAGWTNGGCWSGGGCNRRMVFGCWGAQWWATSAWTHYRTCTRTYASAGGVGGEGGDGRLGRGYNNLAGDLTGNSGNSGGANNGCGSTNGNTGETGGNGGDWGSAGGNTTNTGNGGISGAAISGSNYTITGIINSSTIRGTR